MIYISYQLHDNKNNGKWPQRPGSWTKQEKHGSSGCAVLGLLLGLCCFETRHGRGAAAAGHKGVSVKLWLDFSGLYCSSAKAEKPIITQRNYSLSLKLLRSSILQAFRLISRVQPGRNNAMHKRHCHFGVIWGREYRKIGCKCPSPPLR